MSDATLKRLHAVKIFSGMDEASLQGIAPLFTLQSFKRNQTLITHQDETNSVYFLVSGSVRAAMFSPSGKQVSYQDLHEGDMYGEMAAIDRQPRSTHVIALTNGEQLSLTGDKFLSLVGDHPQIAQAVMLKMTGVIRYLCERMYEFGALSVGGRVRAEILRLARLRGETTTDVVEIDDMPTHEELASRLATHREAITRELGKLEKDGIVRKQRHKLTILKLPALIAGDE